MKKLNLFFTGLFVFLFNDIQAQTSIVSLNSSNSKIVWEIKPQADVSFSGNQISLPGFQFTDYVKGIVPGIVFNSYVAAGKEKDPNFSDNIYKVDEIFYNRPFWYRTEFEIPASYKKGQRVWLHFDGTNRFADFYFNGIKISGTPTSIKDVSGHMLRSKFDVTNLIKETGKNAVAVLIWDADQKKRRDSKEAFGVASSPTYLAAAGWDWMPYVPGRLAGITGNVYLKITGDVVMDDPWVRSDLPNRDIAEISIMPNIKNVSSTNQDVTLNGLIQPGNISFTKNITIPKGETTNITISKNDFPQLAINNPKLWWPNGYGDPNLYTCNLTCTIDGKISDEKEIKFGIRKYEYKMIDNKVGMPVLTLFINGQKLFVKGGNWGMSEYLLRCHGAEYETKISLHKDLNYNMIRCWTGCVTDDEFYDYCDKYGIMVWDDFWLYVAFNDVAQPEAFKANALDKVRRLRNHPCIAVWCGANETHPKPELDNYLREMIAKEDNNDRLYKSCSNQDGLSGSGWWGNQPPKHHFETSGSNLAWNDPPYPYGSDYGYGFRSEIGTATFPVYESIIKFMPQDQLWPLPTDEQLRNDDNTIYNKHFFGKEASNANPVNYKRSVNTEFGESANLQEFCEKAQLLNIEVMKGMYEAWNDKMWNDASGLLIWMSQSAYPSFVWQTYDYYYDATGSYWGAKKACEPQHIQWNCSSNSVKVINTTSKALTNVKAMVNVYDINGKEIGKYRKSAVLNVNPSNINEAFVINFNTSNLALGKKAFASSSTKNMDAALITDGSSGSRWESEYSDPQWIYVDLGKKQKIESVVLKWEAAYAKEYELQVSNDANNWTTIYKQQNSKGGTETIKIKPISAQFVKLNCTSRATIFGYSLFELEVYGKMQKQQELSPVQFVKLKLNDNQGNLLSENFYWRNGIHDEDYTALNNMKEATISCKLIDKNMENDKEKIKLLIKNDSKVIAFANRIRLVNSVTKERVLPLILNENYFSLLPGEEKIITIEADSQLLKGGVDVLLKQFRKEEKNVLKIID
jgi:hypothetical protein